MIFSPEALGELREVFAGIVKESERRIIAHIDSKSENEMDLVEITQTKAAELLGVFPTTIRNWLKSGKIGIFRGGHNPRRVVTVGCIRKYKDKKPS